METVLCAAVGTASHQTVLCAAVGTARGVGFNCCCAISWGGGFLLTLYKLELITADHVKRDEQSVTFRPADHSLSITDRDGEYV